jgi:hypothetical protein
MIHYCDICEDRPDCPDLADHWQNADRLGSSGVATAVDGAYFLSFVLGDNGQW